MHICTYAHMHICTDVHMHMCAYAHIHMYTCAPMNNCTHAHMLNVNNWKIHSNLLDEDLLSRARNVTAPCESLAAIVVTARKTRRASFETGNNKPGDPRLNRRQAFPHTIQGMRLTPV